MATPRKPARKGKQAADPPAWRWWLVEASRTDAGRFRRSGDVYPWWAVRVCGLLGRTEVQSIWTPLDHDISEPLRVLVRAPAWGERVEAGFSAGMGFTRTDSTLTDLGPTDPRPRAAAVDHPLYNVTTVYL